MSLEGFWQKSLNLANGWESLSALLCPQRPWFQPELDYALLPPARSISAPQLQEDQVAATSSLPGARGWFIFVMLPGGLCTGGWPCVVFYKVPAGTDGCQPIHPRSLLWEQVQLMQTV